MGLKIFFDWILYASMAGTIVVILLLTIKCFLKNKLSAKVHYLLWFMLLFKLILPTFDGGLALFDTFNLLPINIFEQGVNTSSILTQSNESTLSSQNEGFLGFPQDYALAISDGPFKIPFRWLFFIWLAGMSLVALYTIVVNYRFSISLKYDQRPIQDVKLLDLFETCKLELNIKSNKLQLFQINTLRSPAIVGLFKPCLLLPLDVVERMGLKKIRHIFLHELIHYKRKDILWNSLSCILQILHWFNPVIWFAFFRMRTDREMSCDYDVLEKLKEEEIITYGETLIELLKLTTPYRKPLLQSGFLDHKTTIKKRIYKIATYTTNKIKRWQILLSIMIFIGTLSLGANSLSENETVFNISDLSGTIQLEDYSTYFSGYKGSFVLLEDDSVIYHIYNEDDTIKRSPPASTFKIIASLAALESQVLKDEHELLAWDYTEHPFETWNKDQTLPTAMYNSVNWFFENLLNQVGQPTLQGYLDESSYGNKDLSGGLTALWGQSNLKISPIEQVNILKALYYEKLPFSKENIAIVKDTILIYEDVNGTLSGKTGTIIVENQHLNGWFIGYVEVDQRVYFFATHIEGEKNASGSIAREITLKILRDSNIYSSITGN